MTRETTTARVLGRLIGGSFREPPGQAAHSSRKVGRRWPEVLTESLLFPYRSRMVPSAATVQRFGDFSFDPGARELRRGQEKLHLSPKCFELLELLLAERPRVVPKVRLYDGLWPKTSVSESSLTKLVTELRAVLGDDAQTPRFVRTAHRFGYAFCADVVEDTGPGIRPSEGQDPPSRRRLL